MNKIFGFLAVGLLVLGMVLQIVLDGSMVGAWIMMGASVVAFVEILIYKKMNEYTYFSGGEKALNITCYIVGIPFFFLKIVFGFFWSIICGMFKIQRKERDKDDSARTKISSIEKIGNQAVRSVSADGKMYDRKGKLIGSAQRYGDKVIVKDANGDELNNAYGTNLTV